MFFIDIVAVVDYDVFGLLIFYLERGCDYVGIYGDFDLNRISGAYGLTMVCIPSCFVRRLMSIFH